jgi:hypothetical protein
MVINHVHLLLIRYTKALEVIKKLHKDQAHEIKTYKLKLENLQTLKDAAYEVHLFMFKFSYCCYEFAGLVPLFSLHILGK